MTWKDKVQGRAAQILESNGEGPLFLQLGVTLEALIDEQQRDQVREKTLLEREIFLDEELMRLHPYTTAPGYGVLARRIETERRIEELRKERAKESVRSAERQTALAISLVELIEMHEVLDG